MLIAQRPTLTEESINPQRSRFVIEPLEPGFGYTLGNSLRRTLLSSIPGAAVTSVRISGALHEFTTLPGVVEDVTEILLNIKGIKASFVLTQYNQMIYISARSIDEVNVQVIMEKLGGGGHMNVAGAQLKDISMEMACERIRDTLKEMKESGEI